MFKHASVRLLLLLMIMSGWCRGQLAGSGANSQGGSWVVDGSSVHSLAQTNDGFLWIGTEEGLYRFDGYSFQKFQPNASLPPLKRVLSLAAGDDGALWIRSQGFLLLKLKQQIFTEPLGEDDDSVRLQALGAGGDKIVASTYGASAIELQSDGSVLYIANHLRLMVLSVARDTRGRVWLGTRDAGVLEVLPNRTVTPLEGKTPKKINCLLTAREGRLWFGTDHGLFSFRDGRVTHQNLPARFSEDTVISLMEDSLHRIWVGTVDGLLRIDPEDGDHVEEITALSPKLPVEATYEDREGNVWVAQGQTLFRLRESSASHFNPCKSPDLETSGAFRVDSTGIWFAPRRGGLMRVRSEICSRFAHPPPTEVLYTIGVDRNVVNVSGRSGHVWSKVGANDFRTDEGHQNADGFPVFCQRKTTDGALWFGTLGYGAMRWDGHQNSVIEERSGLQSNTVYAIDESFDQSVWLGGPGGISIWRDGVTMPVIVHGELPSLDVFSLRSSNSGVMWIGTRKGLGFYRDGTFHSVPITNDPNGVTVYGISEDARGHLWLSTSNAILSLPQASALDGTLSPEQVARIYVEESANGRSEGIQRDDAVQAGPGGEIWMARSTGLVKINSRLLGRIDHAAVPQIEDAEVDGISALFKPGLKVGAGARRLNINIAGLLLSEPDSVALRYRLLNFETEWSQPTRLRQASYTNLSPGHYRFQLEASATQREWSQPAELDIVIRPHLWQTGWFRAIALIAGLLFVALAVRLRVRYVVRQTSIIIQERMGERTRIARELHDTFFQGLQGLMLRFRTVTNQMDSGAARELLEDTLNQSVTVMEEGRDLLLTLRIPDTGQAENIVEDLSRLVNQFRGAGCPRISLETGSPSRVIRETASREILFICREAVSNSIQHAAATKINIYFKADDKGIELLVEDDGIGFPGRSSRADQTSGRWGVLGMRERAGSIGGQLFFEPGRPVGTAVRLTLAPRAAYPYKVPPILRWLAGGG